MPVDRHLVAFVREPRIGRVKSRLARDIGVVGAWSFYRLCLTETLRRLDGGGRWQLWLAITPDASVRQWPHWPLGWRRTPQGDGNLGARLQRVMRTLPPGPAIIVGTDVPSLTAAHIAPAFRLLGNHDAVFGPATDGGYWSVGLRRSPRAPNVFRSVRWSTAHALADTLANTNGLKVAFLETLADIDVVADLRRAELETARSANLNA